MDVVREKFPALRKKVDGSPLIYFDNAATTQKPVEVIEAVRDYYMRGSANIHRGSYRLARRSEDEVEEVRTQLQRFIHAKAREEVVFTSGTTEGIHIVAHSYGYAHVEEGDEVVVSVMEHHSNFLPWKRLCEDKKAVLRVVPLTSRGEIDLAALKKMLSSRTKIVAISYLSNVLGTVNPIAEVSALAHEKGAVVVVDAAQAVAHLEVDVQALDCDFLAFSGHKMYAPTGVGVLYGREALLRQMTPYKVGGGMIQRLSKANDPVYEAPPYRFEAGTPHVAGIVGLGAALRFIQQVGYSFIQHHEKELTTHMCRKLNTLTNIKWLGDIVPQRGIATFTIEGMHTLDVGLRLDLAHIAVRTGAFCAKPLMDYMQVESAVRVSFGVYNTREEVDRFCEVMVKIMSA